MAGNCFFNCGCAGRRPCDGSITIKIISNCFGNAAPVAGAVVSLTFNSTTVTLTAANGGLNTYVFRSADYPPGWASGTPAAITVTSDAHLDGHRSIVLGCGAQSYYEPSFLYPGLYLTKRTMSILARSADCGPDYWLAWPVEVWLGTPGATGSELLGSFTTTGQPAATPTPDSSFAMPHELYGDVDVQIRWVDACGTHVAPPSNLATVAPPCSATFLVACTTYNGCP